MNEKNNQPNQMESNTIAIDQDPHVRDFLGLDRTPKAESSYDKQQAFKRDFEQAAGLSSEPDQTTYRQKRDIEARGRRPMNLTKKALIGAGVVGGVLAVGYIGGQDMKHEQDLVEYDQENKEANIANNPELFNSEQLPANPSDMTVEVPASESLPNEETEQN